MKNVRRSILDNGLRLLYRKRDSEVVWMFITIEAGSQYEKGFHKGIAHLLEHMTLGPSKYGGKNKINEYAARHGCDINGETSLTTTEYKAACPRKHYKKFLQLFADRLKNPEFDEETLANEKKIICEELSMEKDDKNSLVFDSQVKYLYGKSPFSNNTGGTKKDVMAITKEEILKFHKKFYTVENMSIVLNGICKDYKNTVDKYFDMVPTGRTIRRPAINIQKKIRSLKLKKNLEQPTITIGCLIPPFPSKEAYAFEIIRWVMTDRGLNARVVKELREKQGITYYANWGVHDTYLHRVTYFVSGAEKKNIEKIRKVYFRELNEVRDLPDKELREAKVAIKGISKLALDDLETETNNIAYYEEIRHLDGFNKYDQRLDKVTKEDIKSTIDNYLKKSYCKIIFMK